MNSISVPLKKQQQRGSPSTKVPCCRWIPVLEISSVAPEMPVMRDVIFPSHKWKDGFLLFEPFVSILCIIFSTDSWIVVLKINLHQSLWKKILLRFLGPICLCQETVPLVAAMPTSLHGPHCTATTVSPKAFIGA